MEASRGSILGKTLARVAIVLALVAPAVLAAGAITPGQRLYEAAGKGDLASVKTLLAKGADVNHKTRLDLTPLMAVTEPTSPHGYRFHLRAP